MTKQLRQTVAAVGVGMALCVPASALADPLLQFGSIHFDLDGTAGAASVNVQSFVWDRGQVLYKDCFGSQAIGAFGCTIYAQGAATGLLDPNGSSISLPAGVGYSFTLVTPAIMSLPVNTKSTYDGTALSDDMVMFGTTGSDTGSFKIYAYARPADDPIPLTGAGYSAGKEILEGSVHVDQFLLSNAGVVQVLLDQNGVDDWGGLRTYATSGSPRFTINVLSKDDDYFKDPLTFFTLNSPDAIHTDGSTSPFLLTDPSQSVAGMAFAGIADVGVDKVNDIFCEKFAEPGPPSSRCSAEFQGGTTTTFLAPVPEPATLALVGLGLAGLRFGRRRKSVQA